MRKGPRGVKGVTKKGSGTFISINVPDPFFPRCSTAGTPTSATCRCNAGIDRRNDIVGSPWPHPRAHIGAMRVPTKSMRSCTPGMDASNTGLASAHASTSKRQSQSAERAPKTAEAACHGLRCCTCLVHACTILFEAPNTQGPMSNEKRRSFEVRRSNISSRELHAPSPRIRVRKSNVLFSTPSVARANEKDGRFEVQAWKCRSLGFDAPPFFIDAPLFLIDVPTCAVRACTNLVRNRNPVKGVRFIHLDE